MSEGGHGTETTKGRKLLLLPLLGEDLKTGNCRSADFSSLEHLFTIQIIINLTNTYMPTPSISIIKLILAIKWIA